MKNNVIEVVAEFTPMKIVVEPRVIKFTEMKCQKCGCSLGYDSLIDNKNDGIFCDKCNMLQIRKNQ